MRLLFFISILLCLSIPSTAAAQPTGTGTLEVTIHGLNLASHGPLRIALFQDANGWPKFKHALRLQSLPVKANQLSFSFTELPYADNYALLVHHDQNGNGKFDMRWFPFPRPKEGVGVSNNVDEFGSPSFSAARFSLNRPKIRLAIEMNY